MIILLGITLCCSLYSIKDLQDRVRKLERSLSKYKVHIGGNKFRPLLDIEGEE